jgi:hypothetical protein
VEITSGKTAGRHTGDRAVVVESNVEGDVVPLEFCKVKDKLAERVGFEPTVTCATTVFETVYFTPFRAQ